MTHDRRRADAVAHHIADHEGDTAAWQRYGIEPVASDLRGLVSRQVAMGYVHASQPRRPGWQHAVLESLGRGGLAPVQAGAADPLAGLRRALGGQPAGRSAEHTSELQSPDHFVCRLFPVTTTR